MPMIRKNPHAVALGRRGGKATAKVRAERIPAARRSEIGRIAAQARWDAYKALKTQGLANRSIESASGAKVFKTKGLGVPDGAMAVNRRRARPGREKNR